MVLDVVALADQLATELEASGSDERAVNEKRYLKSDLHHYGVSVPVIRKLARRFAREQKDVSKAELIGLTDELWQRDVYELRKLAVNILVARVEVFDAGDVGFVEDLLRRSHTWALIDDLAMNVVAPILSTTPAAQLVRAMWSKDSDFWVRRTAILTLLPQLRRGLDGWGEFSEYASALLGEDEFYIRKAIGWVLREVSKHSSERVFEWMKPRAAMSSSVTFREAVKYLPENQRSELTELRKPALRGTKS